MSGRTSVSGNSCVIPWSASMRISSSMKNGFPSDRSTTNLLTRSVNVAGASRSTIRSRVAGREHVEGDRLAAERILVTRGAEQEQRAA